MASFNTHFVSLFADLPPLLYDPYGAYRFPIRMPYNQPCRIPRYGVFPPFKPPVIHLKTRVCLYPSPGMFKINVLEVFFHIRF
ncbi:MAG: hypothetical protein LBP76_04280 [Treponema sp.]|jgi:hypothetical protein|nr:hypothetical protein [Treponema sp.]